jgi:type II secretion system protein G
MRGLLLVAAVFLLACCAGEGPKKKGKGKKGPSRESAAREEDEAPEPGPVEKAVARMSEIKGDAPFREMVSVLDIEYKEHLWLRALTDRVRVLKLAGVKGLGGLPGRLRELRLRRSIRSPDDVLDKDPDENKEEAEKLARQRFGVDVEKLGASGEEESFRMWLRANWEGEIRPSLAHAAHPVEVRGKRHYLIAGSRPEKRFFFRDPGLGKVLLYGGSLAELAQYARGPRKALLYDLESDERRKKDAAQGTEIIVDKLMSFKRDVGRFPSTEEGLEVLLALPRGIEVVNWNGPYPADLYDPWGGRYIYRNPGRKNAEFVDVFSAGPDRTPGTVDDVGNWD